MVCCAAYLTQPLALCCCVKITHHHRASWALICCSTAGRIRGVTSKFSRRFNMNSGCRLFHLRLLPANSGDSFLKERSSLSVFSASFWCVALTVQYRNTATRIEAFFLWGPCDWENCPVDGRIELWWVDIHMAGWGVFWVYSLTQASQSSVALGMDGTA